MIEYKKRIIDKQIEQQLTALGGILLEGARGVGKSTTAKHYAASYTSLEESPQILNAARVIPRNILQGATPRVIDEWQLAPELWNTARNEIDERNAKGQFILTGSSSPTDNITHHSGAGRFGRVRMRPMSLSEMGKSTNQVSFSSLFEKGFNPKGNNGLTISEFAETLVIGGMPAIFNFPEKSAHIFYEEYIKNITKVELKEVGFNSDPIRIRALINALARNTATQASLETLAKEAELEVGITTKTIRKYLDRLTQIFLLEELPVWKTHIRSSAQIRIKPKWHFMDPAIAVAALGVDSKALLNDLESFGLFFESMVLRDIRAYAESIGADTFFYKDSSELEVDIIVQLGNGKWAAFEVKLGGEHNIKKAEDNLNKLKKSIDKRKLNDLTSLNIITGGEYSYTNPNGINIISIGHLC
jgi:predicted AAA+ superfamily ATPase